MVDPCGNCNNFKLGSEGNESRLGGTITAGKQRGLKCGGNTMWGARKLGESDSGGSESFIVGCFSFGVRIYAVAGSVTAYWDLVLNLRVRI